MVESILDWVEDTRMAHKVIILLLFVGSRRSSCFNSLWNRNGNEPKRFNKPFDHWTIDLQR